MREYGEALLRHSHKGLEAVSRAVGWIRENDLGEAARWLTEAQEIITALMEQVDGRSPTPKPDRGDKG
jgi:hypothetical protein